MKWAQWLNALIGVWFIVSPWIMGFNQLSSATWFSVIAGAILLIVSFWAATQTDAINWSSWQGWVSLIVGIVFVIVSVSVGLPTVAMWTTGILGVIVFILDLLTMGTQE